MTCPPPALVELQKWTAQIITRPLRERGERNLPQFAPEIVAEIEQRIAPGAHLTPAEVIGIHNAQYWFRLFTLLQEQYPTITRLFGYTSFNREIAEPYFLSHPPDHWYVPYLGRFLPQWVNEEYTGEDKLLIYEVALVDAAFEKLTYNPASQALHLHADLLRFRKEMLQHAAPYWNDADFPALEWGKLTEYTVSNFPVDTVYIL